MQAVWLQELGDKEALGRVGRGGGGAEIKLERKAGARHAEHIKDSEQKSVHIQGS